MSLITIFFVSAAFSNLKKSEFFKEELPSPETSTAIISHRSNVVLVSPKQVM